MSDASYPTDASFRALADSSDEALFVVDEFWRLQWANRNAHRLLETSGLSKDPGSFLALFPGDTRDRIVLDGAVVAGGLWRAQGELRLDGLVPIDLVVSAMEGGVPAGWRAVRVRDRAEQRALEDALRDAQALDGVGRLALALAHEFAELLTAITGSAELIASELSAHELSAHELSAHELSAHELSANELNANELNANELSPRDAIRGDVETIRLAADRAAALTRELTRAAASRASAPQTTDLSRAVAAMDATLRRAVGEQVQLSFDLAPDSGRSLLDLSQLEASMVHLARNARAAMPQGGALHVTARTMECPSPRRAVHAVMRPGRYARIEVRDTGVGMDQGTHARCFEPLFSTWGGDGLGLSLVFGAATQMGGYVTCDSAPGEGTSVALFLPLLVDGSAAERSEPQSWTRSVLVVDDQAAVRHIAARSLRREGYRVIEAADADEALALVSRDPSVADLLLTDIVMPGLSGVELARCIIAARPDVRVLFSSGASAMSTGDISRLPRGAAFLPKPFTPRALTDRVRALFGL